MKVSRADFLEYVNERPWWACSVKAGFRYEKDGELVSLPDNQVGLAVWKTTSHGAVIRILKVFDLTSLDGSHDWKDRVNESLAKMIGRVCVEYCMESRRHDDEEPSNSPDKEEGQGELFEYPKEENKEHEQSRD